MTQLEITGYFYHAYSGFLTVLSPDLKEKFLHTHISNAEFFPTIFTKDLSRSIKAGRLKKLKVTVLIEEV